MARRVGSLEYERAVAFVASALNHAQDVEIGNPREGVYKVAFHREPGPPVRELVAHLTVLGIVPTAKVYYDEYALPFRLSVNIYSKTDQRRLFETTEAALDPQPRKQLDDLVLARGPLPQEIRNKIYRSADKGRTARQIARRMNELGVIAGMRGRRWTPRKITNILRARTTKTTTAEAAA